MNLRQAKTEYDEMVKWLEANIPINRLMVVHLKGKETFLIFFSQN